MWCNIVTFVDDDDAVVINDFIADVMNDVTLCNDVDSRICVMS